MRFVVVNLDHAVVAVAGDHHRPPSFSSCCYLVFCPFFFEIRSQGADGWDCWPGRCGGWY